MRYCINCRRVIPDDSPTDYCDICWPTFNPANQYYTQQQYQQPYQQPYQQQYQQPNYQQQYQQPFPPFQPQPIQANKSYASLVLGIIGIVTAFLFALVGHITSIIGIVLGVKEYNSRNDVSGLVLSIIGEILSIISSIIGAITLGGLM